MTALDDEVNQLAGLVNDLSRRSQVALFWAASSAHLASANTWIEGNSVMHSVLGRAQETCYRYCIAEIADRGAADLLDELDQPLPEDLTAQSSWICADAALRIIVDPTFEPGLSIEYALEPVLGFTSEEIFGFWQAGSGEFEERQLAELMAQPAVVAAVDFCRWAIRRLAAQDFFTQASMDEIRTGAVALSGR
jgi:hypothetical protein